MDFSSIPGSAVQSGEFLVYDKLFGENHLLKLKLELMLTYGSLTRPPDSFSTSCVWRKFTTLVCLWSPIASGNLSFVDDVVILERQIVSREGELLLEQLRQDHVFVIADAVAVMRNLEDSYASRDQDLWLESIQQILQFSIDRRWLDFWIVNHVLVFTKSDKRLSSSEYIKDSLILVNHPPNLTSFCLFLKTYVGCFVTLLMLDGVNTARELLCFHLVYKSIRHGLHELQNLLQIMENPYQKCWFLLACLHPAQFNSPVSARYFQRQGEIWSSRTYRLTSLNHEDDYDFVGQGLMLCSASHITFPFPCYIGFIEEFLRFEEVFFVCVSPGCCYLDHVVRIPQELLLRQSLLHQLPKCFFIHSVIIWNQAILYLCQKCDCGAGNCWLEHFDLFLRQRWWLHLLHIGFFRMKKIISVDFPVFLQKQIRDIAFFGHIIAANSGWFGSFLTFFYGSSPRPPDDRCVFGFTLLKFSWDSQDYRVF